jgi:ankyrin repeat protein
LKASPFYTKPNGNQAIDYALRQDPPNWATVLYLISKCKVDGDRAHPSTPLYIASQHGEFDICCRLVEAGVDITAEDGNGLQAIDAALTSKGEWLSILVFLIENGADVNRVRGDISPLIYAVKSRKLDAVKKMVEFGADVLQTCGSTLVKLSAKDFSKVLCEVNCRIRK